MTDAKQFRNPSVRRRVEALSQLANQVMIPDWQAINGECERFASCLDRAAIAAGSADKQNAHLSICVHSDQLQVAVDPFRLLWRNSFSEVPTYDIAALPKDQQDLIFLLRQYVLDVMNAFPGGSHLELPPLDEFRKRIAQILALLNKEPESTERLAEAAAESAAESVTPSKAKRSTGRGEGGAKLIAALTKHHNYADGGCLNLEPIGNNELARLAGVSDSTASAFFNKKFDGHTKYRAICGDATSLVAVLKLLNQEFAPHHLFGAKPPGEDEREDDE